MLPAGMVFLRARNWVRIARVWRVWRCDWLEEVGSGEEDGVGGEVESGGGSGGGNGIVAVMREMS